MRTLIVTGADEHFMPLLRGLVLSLQQFTPRPYADLACFDLGLAFASRDWVEQYARHVIEPRWDLPVAAALREQQPHLRAMTARPFLRDYFPGYDVYLWIDADAWVQESYALEWFVHAASSDGFAAVTEYDRGYRPDPGVTGWRARGQNLYFGDAAGERALWDHYFNSGVFALQAHAPHWDAWARHFDAGLRRCEGSWCSDQTALNHALWTEALPVVPLPAICNWLCHIGVPAYRAEQQRFCEPHLPWQSLGILHLAGASKDLTLTLDRGGRPETISLRFPGF